VLDLLLRTSAAGVIERRIFRPGETLHAPHLIDVEVAQVLRRFVAGRRLTEGRAEEALEDLGDLPLTRYPHGVLLQRVWALRHNLTAYDAVYVALAEALEAPLVTRDAKMASAARSRARIDLV